MSKCEHCPVGKSCPEKPCIVEKFNAVNLCRKVDPTSPEYHPAYVIIIADKSCGTNNYTEAGKNDEPPVKEMPSPWKQVKNFGSAMIDHAKSGFKNVSQEIYDSRMSICSSCDMFIEESKRCSSCGCHMPTKAWLSTAECPLKKWLKEGVTPKKDGCSCNNL